MKCFTKKSSVTLFCEDGHLDFNISVPLRPLKQSPNHFYYCGYYSLGWP